MLLTYDAANRLVEVKNGIGAPVLSYRYGSSNQRLMTIEGGYKTYYAAQGGTVLAEYVEANGQTMPQWTKSYINFGGNLIATITPYGTSERTDFHHPDRLGTRIITNNQDANYQEQVALPFGTALNAESTGATNRRFTSYDRSNTTGLDYAVNRHYDANQGRFTQVDPIGMGASSLADPQSWNMYAYCGNDPVNHTDPDGLFFKKLFKWIGKALKWIMFAVAVVVAVIAVVTFGAIPLLMTLQLALSSASTIANTFGFKKLGMVLGIASAALGLYQNWGKGWIIKNFKEGAQTGAEKLAAWAAGVGAIANLLSLAPQEKPQLERNLSRDTKNYDEWSKHFANCLGNNAATVLIDSSLLLGSLDLLSKKVTLGNASQGTSLISRVFGNGPRFDGRVRAPTGRKFGAKTMYVGRALGRNLPILAGVELGAIFLATIYCTNNRYNRSR